MGFLAPQKPGSVMGLAPTEAWPLTPQRTALAASISPKWSDEPSNLALTNVGFCTKHYFYFISETITFGPSETIFT